MAQYIDKSTLVAEIEKRKIPFKSDVEDGYYPTYLCALMDLEDFINTLEVKEVDLNMSVEQKQQWIEKLENWLENNICNAYNFRGDDISSTFINDCIKAIKGE